MYSEEETELRDLIMQNLENCGFLNKIKAELRAGVFLAFEEDGNLRNKIPLFNKKFDDFMGTSEGKLITSIVREFLEYFNLNFTLSVFDPEIAAPTPFISRSEISHQLNLKISENDGPVISALLKQTTGNQTATNKSSDNLNLALEKSSEISVNKNVSEKNILGNNFNNENSFTVNSFGNDSILKSSHDISTTGKFPKVDTESNNAIEKVSSDVFKDESDHVKKDDDISDIFKKTPVHDSFFDGPLPSEKPSIFTFSDPLKNKSENKLASSTKAELGDSKKSSMSSLRDLPSLAASNEWTFSRDPKNSLPSIDSLKSVSSSEASNEEIINLDSKGAFEKKDSVESNEESSEKQISEESIEEEIDESSAGFDDLLASSLSLGDDVTTDQTVSQVSVVEGVDHVEPCK